MTFNDLKKYLTEAIMEVLTEDSGWYHSTPDPIFRRTDINNMLGKNPIAVDNGNHSNADNIRQISTIDDNGEQLAASQITLSDNGFIIYKIKNFGSDNMKSVLSLFGNNISQAEVAFRAAIDTIYGAARRNGKNVIFRTISPTSIQAKKEDVRNSFWEFSYDNGVKWYIVKPNPTQKMKESELKRK